VWSGLRTGVSKCRANDLGSSAVATFAKRRDARLSAINLISLADTCGRWQSGRRCP